MNKPLSILLLLLAACPSGPSGDSDESTGEDTSTSASTGPGEVTAVDTTTIDPTGLDSTGLDSTGASTTVDTNGVSSSSSSTGLDSSEDTTTGPPPMGGYGDCANEPMNLCLEFGNSEGCLYSGQQGVCSWQDCSSVDECPVPTLPGPVPAHPMPAEVNCLDVSGRGIGDCVIDCTVGLTASCPEGMTCLNLGVANICLWPVLPPGGGACPDIDLGSRVPQTWVGTNAGLVDDVYPLCSFGGGEDALVQWTAPYDGAFQFDTVGSGIDTVLAVLDGCGGTEIGCGDDQFGTASGVVLDMVAGQSVILVADSFDGDTSPAYTINITELPAMIELPEAQSIDKLAVPLENVQRLVQ